MNITVTTHAIEEATKKLGIASHKAQAYIEDNASKARFIANIVSYDGNPCRLFAYQRIAYVMDQYEDKVITVYHRQETEECVKSAVDRTISKLLRQAERKEAATIKEVERKKAELMLEAAQINLKRVTTRAKSVINACTARINAINEEIEALTAEVIAAKDEKRRIAKSLVMYM